MAGLNKASIKQSAARGAAESYTMLVQAKGLTHDGNLVATMLNSGEEIIIKNARMKDGKPAFNFKTLAAPEDSFRAVYENEKFKTCDRSQKLAMFTRLLPENKDGDFYEVGGFEAPGAILRVRGEYEKNEDRNAQKVLLITDQSEKNKYGGWIDVLSKFGAKDGASCHTSLIVADKGAHMVSVGGGEGQEEKHAIINVVADGVDATTDSVNSVVEGILGQGKYVVLAKTTADGAEEVCGRFFSPTMKDGEVYVATPAGHYQREIADFAKDGVSFKAYAADKLFLSKQLKDAEVESLKKQLGEGFKTGILCAAVAHVDGEQVSLVNSFVGVTLTDHAKEVLRGNNGTPPAPVAGINDPGAAQVAGEASLELPQAGDDIAQAASRPRT